MFDIGWTEIMVIAVVALVVIGPKDLPKAIYTLGKWVRKARGVAREFQHHIDDMMREAELDELRQQALKARDLNLTRMVEDTVDPKGTLRGAFDPPATNGAGTAPAATGQPVPLPATEPPVTTPTESPTAPALPAAAETPLPATPVGPAPAAAPAPSGAAQHPDKTA